MGPDRALHLQSLVSVIDPGRLNASQGRAGRTTAQIWDSDGAEINRTGRIVTPSEWEAKSEPVFVLVAELLHG